MIQMRKPVILLGINKRRCLCWHWIDFLNWGTFNYGIKSHYKFAYSNLSSSGKLRLRDYRNIYLGLTKDGRLLFSYKIFFVKQNKTWHRALRNQTIEQFIKNVF